MSIESIEKREIRSICVFCGSSQGTNPEYVEYATKLGAEMARRGIKLVYGGGNVGLMGAVSRAVVENGGEALGVIPFALQPREISGESLVESLIVPDMHTRKSTMAKNADAFIAMPGGFGTLEELFEVVTWAQLGIHTKPIGLLNVAGYYDLLIQFLDQTQANGFVSASARTIVLSQKDPATLLDLLQTAPLYKARITWMTPDPV